MWHEEGAKARRRHRIVKRYSGSRCSFKNLNALNNPFALGTFPGSAKKSSYIAEKDDG